MLRLSIRLTLSRTYLRRIKLMIIFLCGQARTSTVPGGMAQVTQLFQNSDTNLVVKFRHMIRNLVTDKEYVVDDSRMHIQPVYFDPAYVTLLDMTDEMVEDDRLTY